MEYSSEITMSLGYPEKDRFNVSSDQSPRISHSATAVGEAMKPIILALILLNSSVIASALAQTVPGPYPRTSYPVPDPRVAQLETALNQVRQELQVLYQQFLVMQALRQNEIQESFPLATYVPSIEKSPYATSGLIDNPPQSYDEKIRSQKEHQERIQQYTLDINSLHSRYNELGEQKKVLMDQLMELTKALRPGQ